MKLNDFSKNQIKLDEPLNHFDSMISLAVGLSEPFNLSILLTKSENG